MLVDQGRHRFHCCTASVLDSHAPFAIHSPCDSYEPQVKVSPWLPPEEIANITDESFEFLLSWLDPDREQAGQKYESIRAGLIRIFVSKGFNDAEDLADKTIGRVIVRLPEIRDGYIGEPVRYFHGVARNVVLEALRRREIATEVAPSFRCDIDVRSPEYDCLLNCLKFLSGEKRELILDYYLYEGHDKIEQHKLMAKELGITEGALRGRAFHVRVNLEKCILKCLESTAAKQKTALGS